MPAMCGGQGYPKIERPSSLLVHMAGHGVPSPRVIRMSELQHAVDRSLLAGRLPCERSFAVAAELGVAPTQVREAAEERNVRFSRCQLGLFGFEDLGDKRLIHALPKITESLEKQIREALIDGCLSCAAAWRIAEQEALPRFLIGCACETLEVRIAPCQLGCF